MDISDSLPVLAKHGLQTDAIQKLEQLAHRLPSKMLKVQLNGLNEEQALVLMSSMLREVGESLGAEFTHPDVIGLAEYDVVEAPQKQKAAADPAEESEQFREGMAS